MQLCLWKIDMCANNLKLEKHIWISRQRFEKEKRKCCLAFIFIFIFLHLSSPFLWALVSNFFSLLAQILELWVQTLYPSDRDPHKWLSYEFSDFQIRLLLDPHRKSFWNFLPIIQKMCVATLLLLTLNEPNTCIIFYMLYIDFVPLENTNSYHMDK